MWVDMEQKLQVKMERQKYIESFSKSHKLKSRHGVGTPNQSCAGESTILGPYCSFGMMCDREFWPFLFISQKIRVTSASIWILHTSTQLIGKYWDQVRACIKYSTNTIFPSFTLTTERNILKLKINKRH